MIIDIIKSSHGAFAIHKRADKISIKAKYLYVKVINSNRSSIAPNCRIYITKIDIWKIASNNYECQNLSGGLPLVL